MDNPQHYQPLSHALNPPIVQPQYEEEEEEEEGNEEGAVEEQLEREDDDGEDSTGRTFQQGPSATAAGKQRAVPTPPNPPQSTVPPASEDAERKRRPGRPRGSKNRRIRASGTDKEQPTTNTAAPKPATATHGFHQYSAPPAPGEVHPHNQQYYEFQWRVLNLCAEFYGAAEELVKATPSLVIAQCYQMGPAVKIDPLTMLNEAKRICDTLLASPARLTAHPPPPYPFIPGYPSSIPAQQPQPTPPPPSANGKTPPATQSTPPVITNPQSFVVSMGHQHPPPQQFVPGMYGTPAYPTTPYYAYGGYGGFFPPVTAPQAGPSTPTAGTSGSAGAASGSAGNQGAWSDEETEKLKKLAEEYRNASGDIAWDALCEKWGNSRTRHQILIKATSLGLKESSSRGTKRRRDTDGQTSSDRPPPAAPTPTSTDNPAPTPTPTSAPPPPPQSAQASASPAPSTPATSGQPSPAIRHAQTQQHQTTASSRFPYPMPTVAAATSPVISTATPQQQQERQGSTGAYYRRPNPPLASGSKPPSLGHGVTTHQYMYQPNGRRET
ncbi:hypothetical protein BDN67DRAFT_966710 [Paxillus ammoniavirescens]|nr:hypothetical protein BDN67DRAFT_966710 [Paxillus ammoniavirescens]